MLRNLALSSIFLFIFSCSETSDNKSTDGYLKERINYQSKNIYGFENLFDGRSLQANQDVLAYHFPDEYVHPKISIVIASHGSSIGEIIIAGTLSK